MKLVTNLKEVTMLEDVEPIVGGLVKSSIDNNATGLIVQLLNNEEIMVLWSVIPKNVEKKFGEIW
jgi:hypothetical protein